MTKANVILSSGTKIVIEGTPEEVAKAIVLLDGKDVGSQTPKKKTTKKKKSSSPSSSKPKNEGTMARIKNLLGEGFFDTPKGIAEVKEGLEINGHIYPTTSISPALVRLVRNKSLRRVKTDGKWTYVEP